MGAIIFYLCIILLFAAFVGYKSLAQLKIWTDVARQLDLEIEHRWTLLSMKLDGTFQQRETKVWQRSSQGQGRYKRHHTMIRVALHGELWREIDLQSLDCPDAYDSGDLSKSYVGPDVSDLAGRYKIASDSIDGTLEALNNPEALDILSRLDSAYHHFSIGDGYLTVDSLNTLNNSVWFVEWIRDIHDDAEELEHSVAKKTTLEPTHQWSPTD